MWEVRIKTKDDTPPPVEARDGAGYSLTIRHDGTASIYKFGHYGGDDFRLYLNSSTDVDNWIARLVELKALAVENFGENWGSEHGQ